MPFPRRLTSTVVQALVVGITLLIAVPVSAQAPAPGPTAASTLSRADMEAFMLRAKIGKRKGSSKGITGTVRATLSDGTLTHDASIQTIDQSKKEFTSTRGTELNFRDTWRFNVAAYELDKLLDLQMIPATVTRRVDGKDASITWWVDDVLMDEGDRLKKKVSPPSSKQWNDQMMIVRVFDQLIYNTDRNLGNLLIDKQWRIWMIDHTRAFRWQKTLRSPENLQRCERRMLEAMRKLDKPVLERVMKNYLSGGEIDALLARRDLIVAYFDQAGEKALYDLERRSTSH